MSAAVETRTLTVMLPWTPPPRLSPNSNVSQRTRARLRRESRDLATICARDALLTDIHDWPAAYAGPVAVHVLIRWEPRRQTQDSDNIVSQMKGALDALQHAGIIANDRQVTGIVIQQERDPRKRGETVMMVERSGE